MHRRIMVLVALTANRIGGIEGFVVELARQLKQRGWCMTLCYTSEAEGEVKDFLLSPGNVTLEVVKRQEGLQLASLKDFVRLVLRYKPSIVLYSLGGPVRWWPLAGRLAGVRRTVYYDQTSRTQKQMSYHASSKIRFIMRPLSEVICATAFVKSCSDREGIVPASKSRVIFSQIDNDRDLGDGRAFVRNYNIPEDRQIVLQISWLVPAKGIDVALRAAEQVLRKRRDLQFVFCGDGSHREEYETLAETLGISNHVTWCGHFENLPASGALRAAQIQIQVSQWHEAFCLSVAEGMSAGLPIVAARIGGLPELVQDGVNGYLFEPSDATALATAILKLADDGSLRTRMGHASRDLAVNHYDLHKNVAAWVEVLTGQAA